jgi:hypothetical protein
MQCLNTVTKFIFCRFLDRLNEVVSAVSFLKLLNFPFLICMTAFQMTQVSLNKCLVSLLVEIPYIGWVQNKIRVGVESGRHRLLGS